MGNIWHVFLRDVKRLVRVPLALVIIGGALITPSLYAWFNISAFWDPFDNTKNLPIAVVNLDEGGSTPVTGQVNVGDQLVAQLQDNDDLGWQFLSESEAMDSLKSGDSFAAFVVPASFTSDLLSLTTGDVTQPRLEYYVNEKLNGVAPEITDTGATTVQTQMTEAFSQQVAEAVTTALEQAGSAAEQDLLNTEASIIADLESAVEVVAETRGLIANLQGDLAASGDEIRNDIATLSSIDGALVDTQSTLNDVSALADRAQSELFRMAEEATTGSVIGSAEVAGAATSAIAGIAQVAAASSSLSAAVEAQRTLLSTAGDLANGIDGQLARTSSALVSLDSDLAGLEADVNLAVSDLRSLGGAALWQELQSLTSLNADEIAQFLSAPVEVKERTIFPTTTYGSQMAALFINLSLWIGAFVLVVILRVNVDKEGVPNLTERQGYMGRWLLFASIAVLQAITLSVGNLIIGVQHVNPFVFIVTPILIGLCYLSIIYALAVTFGYIGKGLVVILVILQIPGASGIYPIQLMPEFFQSLYPWFPFTYGIDATREVISGFAGFAYWRYIGALALFAAVAFFIGLVLRKSVSGLTRLFTQQVAETELIAAEADVPVGPAYRLNHVLRALANRKDYQTTTTKRAVAFARSYRKVRTAILITGVAGVVAIAAFAMIFPDQRIGFVGSWIVWLVIVFAALVVLEYVRYSLRLSTEVSEMPDAELRRELEKLEEVR